MTALRELLRTTGSVLGDAATAVREWDVPVGYLQGRGSWGGLPVGAFLDATIAAVDDPTLRPRSLSAHLLAPLAPGPARIELRLLRRGSATLTVGALLMAYEAQRDGVSNEPTLVADAVVVFGAERAPDLDFSSPVWHPHEPPACLADGWQSLEPADLPVGLSPEFFQRLVVRPVAGFPHSHVHPPDVIGWVSTPEGVAPDDPVILGALADAWWPSTLVPLAQPRPVATLAFSLELIDLPTVDEPLLHRGRLLSAAHGYVAEVRELWSPDGRLLSVNQQTMVIIR